MNQSQLYVIPATPDIIVRDPQTMQPVPPEGRTVPDESYWRRRIRDGDLKEGKPPRATPQLGKAKDAREET